jgi:hypothetical protein
MNNTKTGAWTNGKFLKFLFAASVAAFTLLEITHIERTGTFTNKAPIIAANMLLSFLIALWFEHSRKLLERCYAVRSSRALFISISLTVFTVFEICKAFYGHLVIRYEKIAEMTSRIGAGISAFDKELLIVGIAICGIVAGFSIFSVYHILISRFRSEILPRIKEIVNNTDRVERIFFFAGTVLFSIFVTIAYSKTDIFYTTITVYNGVYSVDSGSYILTDVYFNLYAIENDVRQMLFGAVSMPFALLAKLLAVLFCFLPNAYILFMQLIQVILMLVTGIMITRMMRPQGIVSKIFALLLYVATYHFLLFSLLVEQYIFATFTFILAVYLFYFRKNGTVIPAIFASGTLITNAIILPLISFRKNIKEWLLSFVNLILSFIAVSVICGKLITLLSALHVIKNLVDDFGGLKLSLYSKILQYLNFVASCFFKPATAIVVSDGLPTYQLAEVTGISIAGVALSVLAIAGFALNYKQLFARICLFWCALSFAVLVVGGWGTRENVLMLYTLYFGWAIYALVFMFFEKLFSEWKAAKYAVYSFLLSVLLFCNITGVADLLDFAAYFYPVR